MKGTQNTTGQPPHTLIPSELQSAGVSDRRNSQILGIIVLALLLLVIAVIRYYF
jgi:hypothetical protein